MAVVLSFSYELFTHLYSSQKLVRSYRRNNYLDLDFDRVLKLMT